MILGDDGAKLSKRHGAVSVMQYRDEGYLPNALNNYLVRLGWSHGDQEIFSQEEMIEFFSLKAISKSASAFNTDKLLWLNNHYIKTSEPEYVAKYLQWHLDAQKIDTTNGPAITEVIKLVGERCNTLIELAEQSRYFYEDFSEFSKTIIDSSSSIVMIDASSSIVTMESSSLTVTIESPSPTGLSGSEEERSKTC